MVLFFYGEDVWRKQQKVDQLIARFIKEVDPSRMNALTLSQEDAQEETLRSQLTAAPFLGRKRLIIIKNFLTGKRKWPVEILCAVLEKASEHTTFVISEDESKPKKWKYPEAKALWEYLEKNAQTEEFKPLWGSKFEAILAQEAKKRGLAFDPEALALLAQYCAGDLGQAQQELDKLTAYTQSRHSERSEESHTNVCTTADIKAVCISSSESSIFDFLDALGNKNQKILISTLEEQLEDVDPVQLLARATSHLRGLLALKLMGETGAQVLKLHPFQLKKMLSQIRHWDAPTLQALLAKLLHFDYSIKRGAVSDPRAQLATLLARV